jgi:hypothetical protein
MNQTRDQPNEKQGHLLAATFDAFLKVALIFFTLKPLRVHYTLSRQPYGRRVQRVLQQGGFGFYNMFSTIDGLSDVKNVNVRSTVL